MSTASASQATAKLAAPPPTPPLPPLWKRKEFWIALVGTVALLLGGMYYMAAFWPVLPIEKIAQPVVVYSKLPPESKFSISLEAPIDHPDARELDVTLVIANSGVSIIRFLPLDKGWPFQAGDCPSLRVGKQQSKSALTIDPHSSTTYLLHLVADCPSEAQPISLHYKAQVGDNPASEVDGYIQTAPLTVVGEGRRTFAKFITLLNGLLHLFLAPVVLAAFGWWLNNLISHRDARLKREQEDRDRKLRRREAKRDRLLKEQQESRDRRNDVLNTLITNYRDLVFGDYLPIVRRMQAVEVEIPLTLKSPVAGPLATSLAEADVARLLCAILLFRARLLSFLTRKGGIYFRSKEAERLLADLLGGFFSKVWAVLGKEEFEQAVQMLQPDDTLILARQKYASGIVSPPFTAKQVEQVVGILAPEQVAIIAQLVAEHDAENKKLYQENQNHYETLQKKFLAWVNNEPVAFREYTRLLQIATELLEFECDRPFYQTGPLGENSELQTSGWYFDPPVIELTHKMYEIPRELKDKTEDNPTTGATGQRGISPQLYDYWISIPDKCRGTSPEPPK